MEKNVLFVMQSMAVGGISTSLVNLLEHIEELKKENLNIELLNFAKTTVDKKIPGFVNVKYANKNLELAATPFFNVIKSRKIIDIIRRIILMIRVRMIGSEAFYRHEFEKIYSDKKYDVAISYSNDVPGSFFNQGTNLYVADYVDATKKIAWIHTDPIKMGFDKNHCEKLYKKYESIICVSNAVKENFDTLLPVFSDKTEVFYNVFNKGRITSKAEEYLPFERKNVYNIVTVCRIDNETKRIDGIIKICSRLKTEGITDFKWRIVGDGPQLKKNMKLAEQLKVVDVLEFSGEKENPYPYILHSDLFALYSKYEGYPMVIGEAKALETYVLTTNYAAAKEQVDDLNGQVAETDEEFFQKLKKLILNNSKK